jgi:magnesium transporter
MINFYKTTGDKLCRIDGIEENCWVSAVAPSEEELFKLSAKTAVGLDFLRAALDVEETSRIEITENSILILISVPSAQKRDNTVSYTVVPMSIIITRQNIITVCLRQNSIISDFADGLVRNVQTSQKTKFVLQILMHMSARFLQYLRQISKITGYIENQLYSSLRNKELMQLFDLGKSLIYFSASLKASEITLEKILRGRVIKLSNDERELLEDVLIEVKQAVEMTEIYSRVLTSTTKAFSTVRTNNLNHLLKLLISAVIVLAIPIIVALYYIISITGAASPHLWFSILLSVITMVAAGVTLYYKKMY